MTKQNFYQSFTTKHIIQQYVRVLIYAYRAQFSGRGRCLIIKRKRGKNT